MKQFSHLAALTLILGLQPTLAFAYIGPGAGLGMIGSLLAVVGALLIAIFGLIIFPITLLRKRRREKAKGETASTTGDQTTAAVSDHE